MASYDDVVAMTADWPGVTADKWYGTPGLKVGGKGFARMWGDREYKRDGVDDTEVLVVIGDVDPDDLVGYLEDSYRLKASAKLLAAFDDG